MSINKILLILGLSAVSIFNDAECVPFAVLKKIENNDANEIATPLGNVDQKDIAFVIQSQSMPRNIETRLLDMHPRAHDVIPNARSIMMPQIRKQMTGSGHFNRNIQAMVQNPPPKQLYVPIGVNQFKGAQQDLLRNVLIPRGRNQIQPLPSVLSGGNFQLDGISGQLRNLQIIRANPSTNVPKPSIIVIGKPDTPDMRLHKSLVLGHPDLPFDQPRLSPYPIIQSDINPPISPDPRDALIRQLYLELKRNQNALKLKTTSPLILMNGALEISSLTGSGTTGSAQIAESKTSSGD